MKVSIIIPVYNAETTIGKCFRSVLKQTYTDWEIIAINDGSKDNSEKILQKYAEKYPKKIKVISQENCGVAKTRNRGIKEADGTYIMFIDNDDYIEKDYIEIFVKAAAEGDYDCVVGGYRRVNSKGKIIQQYAPVSEWMQYAILTPWARIIKKSVLDENNIHFLEYSFGEDLYFNMMLFNVTHKVKRLDYKGYIWFYNEESVSNTEQKGLKRSYDVLYTLEQIDEILEKPRKQLFDLWYAKYIVWYLCFSGRNASAKEFVEEEKRLMAWLKSKNIPLRFPVFSKSVKGEPFRNKLIVKVFFWLEKCNMIGLFAKIYCKG